MTGPTVLSARSRSAVAWKNGGGITREVAAYPPGSDMESFLWRLSIAEVNQPGPFSRYDGVDRTLAVLRGKLELLFGAGSASAILDADAEPLPFSGDEPVFGVPLGGPVMDLNAMVRRGRFHAATRAAQAGDRLGAPGSTTIFVALQPVIMACLGRDWSLSPLDAFSFAGDEARVAQSGGEGTAGYVVDFATVGARMQE